jgi:capsular exopolysaccharide synthesis family protein
VTLDQIASILWRRRLVFVGTLIVCLGLVTGITFSLSKTYKATATLFVGTQQQNVGTTDLLEQLTRTYAHLAGNPNVAAEVAKTLDPPISRSKLLSKMSFSPVERTQLLQISAEASSPEKAARTANLYAAVFVNRVTQRAEGSEAEVKLSVSEPAALPTDPVRPNPPLYLGLGALLSVLLAFGVTLAVDRLDKRIRLPQEDTTFLGEPILARIPKFGLRNGVVPVEVADLFGLMKTNLDFFGDGPAQVLMVTSPGLGEGKSTIAACLALACAAEGERVALIEADLRRPSLERALPFDGKTRTTRSSVGLSDYLLDTARADEIVVPDPANRGLSIVWAGPVPKNPTALLRSDRLDVLLETLRPDFERIVIDAPSVSVAADASVMAPRMDGTVYVIDESITSRSLAQSGLDQLRKIRARLLGITVNRSNVPLIPEYYAAPAQEEQAVEGSRRRAKRSAARG